jgi:hypothetical protein
MSANIAHEIAEELQNSEEARPSKYGAGLKVQPNTISLSTQSRTLTIICNGVDTFDLRDNFGPQTRVRVNPPPQISTRDGEPVSKSEMWRRVIAWERAHRTT